MPATAVIGMQWGDEGKAKIVDILTKDMDIIARFQGGHNAGHTVVADQQKYIFHLIPTGILRPDKFCVIGNGLVIDPRALKNEIQDLESKGIQVSNRLMISSRAHVILPMHLSMETYSENIRGKNKINTTLRGIGPCYTTKAARSGIQVGDLLDRDILYKKIDHFLKEWKNFFHNPDSFSSLELTRDYHALGLELENYIGDVSEFVHDALDKGKNVLCEGAQGTMLDMDHGTYPYVTSSNTTIGGICCGLGVPIRKINKIIGITKAYSTRVGAGPYPTELTGTTGELLREKGNEYGSSTGRPRRCGWLDLPVLRYSSRINGIDTIALTKLDVLDGFDTIKVCTEYVYKGETFQTVPWQTGLFSKCQPVYQELHGWKTSLRNMKRLEDLPRQARNYIKFVEDSLHIPVGYISTGPNREHIIQVSH